MSNDFNFIVDPLPPKDEPTYIGPNLKGVAKMTPRKFAQSVLEVFDTLGGASWLLTQAQVDPKAFLTLLQKLIPKSVQLDDLTGLQVSLIDQFGNEVRISSNECSGACPDAATAPRQLDNGHLQIATSGSPPPDQESSTGQEATPPQYSLKDIFE